MERPVVLLVVGSRSDLEVMAEGRRTLDWFGVPSELVVASAHREPEKVGALAKRARERLGDNRGGRHGAHLAGWLRPDDPSVIGSLQRAVRALDPPLDRAHALDRWSRVARTRGNRTRLFCSGIFWAASWSRN
jgi:hypothetical protein